MTVVFSDVGGTIFGGEPWSHLRHHPKFNQARLRWETAKFIPTLVMHRIGFMDETQMRRVWLAGMAQILKGMKREDVMQMYSDTLEGSLQAVMRHDVIERLQKHKAEGATVVLVSGIFADLVELIARQIGVDAAIGTNLEFIGEVATGKLIGIPSVGAQKIDLIHQYMRDNHPQTKLEDCYAYADSYSDRALLSAVGHGVAAHPDRKMLEAALANNWEIMPAIENV
jgi:HAD superfamily hydrolase (TIGR01490 family)